MSSWFCIYAAITVLFVYFYYLTFFCAVMAFAAGSEENIRKPIAEHVFP